MAQARFQSSLFAGLLKLGSGQFNFKVFSSKIPARFQDDEVFQYVALVKNGRCSGLSFMVRSRISSIVLLGCRLFGAKNNRIFDRMLRWKKYEPKYFQQLRDLDIRLLWNMNQHALPVSIPFIRTIWDVNHRINSMYPEFSYSRFTFDGLDADIENSLARASYVIVGTEEGKRQLVDIFGVDHRKVRIIPFPTPELSTADLCSDAVLKVIQKGPYIFYPARMWPHKNHVTILEALRILRANGGGANLRCVFSGADEGNLDYVLRYANKLGLGGQLDYVGVVAESDIAYLYQRAFALVYASGVGPDNLPPLEAMALGCPVIAADVPGAREQFGNAALFFDPMNENEIAERIRELAKSGLLRDDLVQRGRDRAAAWSVEDYARSIRSILNEFALVARAWERSDSKFT